MPTIADLHARFKEELNHHFSQREIDQFFAMTFDELLGYSRAELQIRRDQRLSDAHLAMVEVVLKGLQLHKPIQYLLGHTEFYGLRFKVDSHVLIPRPETEELVRWITYEAGNSTKSILDLGTGSGCIAISLKKSLPHVNVYAVDKSIEALNLAKKNAELNDVGIEFFAFDLLKQESLGFRNFDIMVSNPPYVTLDDKQKMEKNVVDNEPHLALFVPADDPLVFYRKIVDLADGHLNKGGKIFFEINESFGQEIRSLLADRGFTSVEIKNDLNGRPRMAKGIKT